MCSLASYSIFLILENTVSAWQVLPSLYITLPHLPWVPLCSTLPTGGNGPSARQQGPLTSSHLPPRAPRRGLILFPQGPGNHAAEGDTAWYHCGALVHKRHLGLSQPVPGLWQFQILAARLPPLSPPTALLFQGLQSPEHLCIGHLTVLMPYSSPDHLQGALQFMPKTIPMLLPLCIHAAVTQNTHHEHPPPREKQDAWRFQHQSPWSLVSPQARKLGLRGCDHQPVGG